MSKFKSSLTDYVKNDGQRLRFEVEKKLATKQEAEKQASIDAAVAAARPAGLLGRLFI